MKIGILTHPLMLNYGGILQNYALQTVLRDMGHDVYTINRQPVFDYKISIRSIGGFLNRFIKDLHQHKVTRWNPNIPYTEEEYRTASVDINSFIDKYIIRTRPVRDLDLYSIDNEYRFDCYVVGSDQVWVPGCCPLSFIPFTHRNNVRKITYAASAGNVSWMDIDYLRTRCVELSNDFSSLSVREDYLKDKAEMVLGRNIKVVLDPTMLLQADSYKSLIAYDNILRDNVFSYVLDPTREKTMIISQLGAFLDLPIVSGFTIDTTKRITRNLPGVDDWLSRVMSSRFVITDSFHGCVFSILFKKQFAVLINEKRGADRFNTLLSKFNLMDRVISTSNDISKCINSVIDYKCIDAIIKTEREESLLFLNDALISK